MRVSACVYSFHRLRKQVALFKNKVNTVNRLDIIYELFGIIQMRYCPNMWVCPGAINESLEFHRMHRFHDGDYVIIFSDCQLTGGAVRVTIKRKGKLVERILLHYGDNR